MKRLIFLVPLVLIFLRTSSQSLYQQNYFGSPIDVPIRLSGNFGELRNNHFHAGLDIKTMNQENMKIYAIADGYVSRIKISSVGYGKVLYITHPNGYVSAYAHLNRFNDTLARYVEMEQYKKESFEIELFPDKDELMVKKGELIAFSGNTGSSAGPHLHFEIREADTERPVNPLLFGFQVSDHTKPNLHQIVIYPLDVNSYVNSKNYPLHLKIKNNAGKLFVIPDTIQSIGNIGFAIEAYDSEDNSSNRNGVFSVELKKNDQRIYYHEMEKVGFDETRYINCFIDYEEKSKSGKTLQQCFLLKNNKLNIYKDLLNRGIVSISGDSIHKLTYVVKDFHGNASTLQFYIQGKNNKENKPDKLTSSYSAVFHCQEANEFKTNDVSISLPENILYEDIRFTFSASKAAPPWAITPVYSIHNAYTPLHSYYTLSIRADSLNDALKEKATIISIDRKGKRSNEGGEWKNGFITTETRSFGDFAVMIDTIKPSVKPINISNNKSIGSQGTIKFKVTDNLTDIIEYRGTIDGKWVLFEYDKKNNLLTYHIDKRVQKGKHILRLEVKDGRNNLSTYHATFHR